MVENWEQLVSYLQVPKPTVIIHFGWGGVLLKRSPGQWHTWEKGEKKKKKTYQNSVFLNFILTKNRICQLLLDIITTVLFSTYPPKPYFHCFFYKKISLPRESHGSWGFNSSWNSVRSFLFLDAYTLSPNNLFMLCIRNKIKLCYV
jgi:hypothetical protein